LELMGSVPKVSSVVPGVDVELKHQGPGESAMENNPFAYCRFCNSEDIPKLHTSGLCGFATVKHPFKLGFPPVMLSNAQE
jgi:hypothetical protein